MLFSQKTDIHFKSMMLYDSLRSIKIDFLKLGTSISPEKPWNSRNDPMWRDPYSPISEGIINSGPKNENNVSVQTTPSKSVINFEAIY